MTRARGIVVIGIVLFVGVTVVGHLLGQPMFLGYVTTDSMEPTIEEGDGFVTIPAAIAGPVEAGDVVVYDARAIHDGGFVTHRVIDSTTDGYVTRGDANPFTDQDTGEPPVGDEQIVAKAVQIDGTVLVIPSLGTSVGGLQTVNQRLSADLVGTALMLVGLGLLVVSVLLDRRPGRRTTARSTSRRSVVSVWVLVLAVIVVLGMVSTIAMVVPASTHEYGIVSSTAPSDEPGVIQRGGTEDVAHEIENRGLVPVLVVLEPGSDDVTVGRESTLVGAGSTKTVTVTVSAPEATGSYHRHVTDHRYLTVLPPSVITSLHGAHPYAALSAVNIVIGGIAGALLVALFGRDKLRIRTVGTHVPGWVRLRRRLERMRNYLTG